MTRHQVYRQICAILEANSLDWTQTSNDDIFLRFASAGVTIELVDWGAQTLIQIGSNVLGAVEQPRKRVLREVNRLNTLAHFGRWVYYEDTATVALEYDLLGDHLQENELMTALAAIARLADYHDDQLQRELGGQRAFEA